MRECRASLVLNARSSAVMYTVASEGSIWMIISIRNGMYGILSYLSNNAVGNAPSISCIVAEDSNLGREGVVLSNGMACKLTEDTHVRCGSS